jgi:hypothetical protein
MLWAAISLTTSSNISARDETASSSTHQDLERARCVSRSAVGGTERRRERCSIARADVGTVFVAEAVLRAYLRTVHQTWSALFLGHMLEAESEREAKLRFGRRVTTLLSLVDEE